MAHIESSERGGILPVIHREEFDAHLQSQHEQGEQSDIQDTMDWLGEYNPEYLCCILGLASVAAQRNASKEIFSPEAARLKHQMLVHTFTVLGALRRQQELAKYTDFEAQFAA